MSVKEEPIPIYRQCEYGDTYCGNDAPFSQYFIRPQYILDSLKPQAEYINPEELEKWKTGKMVKESLR